MTDKAERGGASNAMTCGQCGSARITTSLQNDAFQYGDDSNAVKLMVNVPVHSCANCGFQFTTEEAEELRHDAVCKHLGVLSPAAVREIRGRYDLTRERFAAATGLGTASLARWETGELIQSSAHDNFLRLLAYPENLARLGQRVKEVPTLRDSKVTSMEYQRERRFKALAASGRYEERALVGERFTLCLGAASR
jgi:putative zinc finger/helix-turn-helix YgiT family protein